MNTEKNNFIEYILQPFIKHLDNDVETLIYIYDKELGEEYCNIKYKNKYERKVCITADSERAITNDILKAL